MHQRLRWILPVLGGCLLVASLVGMLAPLILPDAMPARSGSVLLPEDSSSPPPGSLGGPGGGMASIALTPLTEQPTVYGANEDGTCRQELWTPEEAVGHLGLAPSALAASYRNTTDVRLCPDHWMWQNRTTLATTDALSTLQWPADLVEEESLSLEIELIPLQDLLEQPASQPDQPEIQCPWLATPILTMDVCVPVKLLIGAVATAVRWVYQQVLAPQAGFLWRTPTEELTRENSALNQTWQVSQAIVLAFLAAVIAWSGLRYLMGSAVDWLSYATLIEILPRIILGLTVALLSRQIMLALIGANNVLADLFSRTAMDLLTEPQQGVIANLLQIIYGVMAILLLAEGAARMAILYLLYAFAPILFFCLALRETEQIARVSLTTMILFTFLQTMQIAVLDVGSQVFSGITGTASLFLLHILVMIAILYITLLLFFMAMQWALGSAANPLAFGTLGLTGRMAKGMGKLASHPVTSLASQVLGPGLARTGSSLGTTAWSGMHSLAGKAARGKQSTTTAPSKSMASPSRVTPAPRTGTASSGTPTSTGGTSSGTGPAGSVIPARASARPQPAISGTSVAGKGGSGATASPSGKRTRAVPARTAAAPPSATSIARRRRAATPAIRPAPSPGRSPIPPRASRPGASSSVNRSPRLPPLPPAP